MSRSVAIFRLAVGFLLLPALSLKASDPLIFNFDQDKLSIEKREGYDFIRYPFLDYTLQVGAPLLPVKIIQIPLRTGSKIQSVRITEIEKNPIAGTFNIYPVQQPQLISKTDFAFTEPDANIYSLSGLFPENVIAIASTGSFSGCSVGTVVLHPVQYHPAEKKLFFISKIAFEIIYSGQPDLQKPVQKSGYIQNIIDQSLENVLYTVVQQTQISESEQSPQAIGIGEHPYIIITSDDLVSHFQPLADWKTRKGLAARIVTLSSITTAYPGRDDPERVRNFIIHAHQNWGTIWVLLGGDIHVVPHRLTFAFDCEYGDYSDNYIPCDLYYSDLDGNWDANENNLFGEVDDLIDMYPDVFVGRAPVENKAETDAFVEKVLTYEKSRNGHEVNALLLAEVFWDTPFTNGGVSKDYIDHHFIPPQFDPVTKLYAVNNNENLETVIHAMNQGQNLINHNGHAWHTGISTGDGFFTNNDADALANDAKYSICFSVGCWPAAIDYDCVAERLVTNPRGGCVAFVGNSRYGWGSPGNPLYGYSDRFDQQFFRQIFIQEGHHIGSVLAAAKAVYVPFASQENVYRWCEYQILLLGDPEMPVWTDEPRDFTVVCPDTLPVGKTQCHILVQDGEGPFPNAMVCLMQDDHVYHTGITDISGRVTFSIDTDNPIKDLDLTVTGSNFLPYETSIPLVADLPYVHITSLVLQNSESMIVLPGDTVQADIMIKNYGLQDASNVQAVLIHSSEEIQSLTDTTRIHMIPGLDSVRIEGAYSFIVDSNLKNGDAVPLHFHIQDDAGHTWQDDIVLIAGTPLLSVFDFIIDDSEFGDGDGFAEPGENVRMDVSVINSGLVTADGVNPVLTSTDQLMFSDFTPQNSALPAKDTLLFSTTMQVDVSAIHPSFHQVVILLETVKGYSFSDTLLVTIGELGIRDHVELGELQWSHSGSPDLWHRVMHRKHSGHFSWYCGDSDTRTYANNMEASLVSDPFTIDENSELSFWCWYECPNYGTTGLYAEIHDGTLWTVLDFIGSGGALGILPTGNAWIKYVYDISHIPRGTECRIRFRFQGDGEAVTEGAYVDDIIIQNKRIPFAYSAPPIPPDPQFEMKDANQKIALDWSISESNCESYNEQGYTFQGYNVYQVSTSEEPFIDPVRIATFDLADGIQEVAETIVDPMTQAGVKWVFQQGTDSGIEHSLHVGKDYISDGYLVKGKPYHFAVTVYATADDTTSVPRSIESALHPMTFIYQQNEPGYGWGDTVAVSHVMGESDAVVAPIALDPSQLTGHQYYIQITAETDGELVWSLKDLNLDEELFTQMEIPGDVLVDGFQLFVQDVAQVNYKSITIRGEGSYAIGSHYDRDWSPTARSQDTFLDGCCMDPVELGDDYELRFTGEYETLSNGVVVVKQGTGSLATIAAARNYPLGLHPLNPDPGNDVPFLVRIPFEVWNIDENRQINFVIYDREQHIDDRPFYALSIDKRMYCWFVNTPYEETVFSFNPEDKLHLTWNVDFWNFDFVKGDTITLQFENPLTPDDVYAFVTDADSSVRIQTIPTSFQLMQNFPNPFNASTTIRFHVPRSSHVVIKVYSILGAELETLVDGQFSTNEHHIEWQNVNLPSGIYFLRMEAGGVIKTKKCIILK